MASTFSALITNREGKPIPTLVDVAPHHHRVVTCISGFETFCLDADSLAEALEIACDSSSAIQPDPENSELKRIVVRGERFKAAVTCLIAMGVPRRWIEVINRRVRKRR